MNNTPVKLGGNHDLLNFSRYPVMLIAKTSEHLWQAMKATNTDDFRYVLAAKDPHEAKRRGREIELRADWERVKWPLMVAVLIIKMCDHVELRKRLLATDQRPIHEARADPEWGMGRDGSGRSLMGRALQAARGVIKLGRQV